MEKKVGKGLSVKGKCSLRLSRNTIPLDSSSDVDIIECSFVDKNNYNNKKSARNGFNTPVRTKGLPSPCGSCRSSNNALKLNLKKSYKLIDNVVTEKKSDLNSIDTPCPNKNSKDSNSAVKKLISTLKKTPDGPYLSKSKLRNIEQWLNENAVETVCTPPFANLSVTPPVNSSRRRFSSRLREENKNSCYRESSLDSEVEDVLKLVYGSDWSKKNVQSQVRTEPKKKTKKFFSTSSTTKKKFSDHYLVKYNILNEKKSNLENKSDEENNFDDSVLSGIKVMSSDSSSCCSESMKMTTRKKKKKFNMGNQSFESLCISSVKKRSKTKPLVEMENHKQNSKSSASKKLISQIAVKTPKKTFLASLSVSTPTSKCHPEATYYKVNFKSKKDELVKKLFKLYNAEVFDRKLAEDMKFSWNVKLRGTAGYCYNKRVTKSTGEIIRLSRIEFSSKIVDRADRLRDTMIHELCHAASWMIDGVLDGHGDVWNKWVSKAMNRFSELPTIKRCHNYEIVSKYVYKCTGCGYSIKRHSKSINTERKRCGHCYGVLELLINKRKKGRKEVPEFDTTKTLPTPNKFAMFVKENYHNVKSAKMNAKHSEIMKALSQQYALIKNGSQSTGKSAIINESIQ